MPTTDHQQCRSRRGDLTCQRPYPHEGMHRAEAGAIDPKIMVALVPQSHDQPPAASVVGWS